ncbi:hypothetical protein LCGC14_0860930 [marine sediment metagenome]|uniref:Uncharacterized protein n=1 Tax=marine sediment metagenome TaxID=412755 RepID=A0A0F9PCH0_9ZZZZ
MLLYKTWEGLGYASGNRIAIDSMESVYITGETSSYEPGFSNVFLLKYGLDTDSDGLSDDIENNTYFTDSNNSDTDGDGLSDGWEVKYDLNAT